MHGNVFEWVWCGRRTYTSAPQVDPVHNAPTGDTRVLRGGAWSSLGMWTRSAYRPVGGPAAEFAQNGFRPVRWAD